MRRQRFRPGDDAVSPVVGVVLLVGIAVMLMTTIGVFVLGFGPGEQPPEAEIQFHQDSNGNVTISVVNPDDLRADNVEVRVNGSAACYISSNDWQSGGKLSTGESVTVGDGSPCTGLSSPATVRVVWTSSGGGQSAIVGEYEVA